MSFAAALNILRPTLPYYVALTKDGLLQIDQHSFEFDLNPKAPALAVEMAKAVFTMGASSCTESYVMSRTLAEGPKVFTFSDALTCEALENFDLSVSTTDYLQPFPSVVIELPADYTVSACFLDTIFDTGREMACTSAAQNDVKYCYEIV